MPWHRQTQRLSTNKTYYTVLVQRIICPLHELYIKLGKRWGIPMIFGVEAKATHTQKQSRRNREFEKHKTYYKKKTVYIKNTNAHTLGVEQKLQKIPGAQIFALNILSFVCSTSENNSRSGSSRRSDLGFIYFVVVVRVAKNTFFCFAHQNRWQFCIRHYTSVLEQQIFCWN